MAVKKLFIMSGGVGSEREVSLASGRYCADALRESSVDFEEMIVEKDKTLLYKGEKLSEEDGFSFLKRENALVFQVIHGTYGEDGELTKKLEECGIAYIGSDSVVMKIAFDKSRAEKILKESGMSVTESILVRNISDIGLVRDFSLPIIIKPNKEGSSVGVIKVNEGEDLESIVKKNLSEFGELLVQKCVVGREFTCGVLEISGKEVALVPSEVVMEDGMLFDYHAKYFVNGLEITPANVDESMTKSIQETALKVHKVLGCKDISRTDMILNENDELVVLEINTIPGMTDVSFVPAEMKASGYSLKDFIGGMVKKYS